MAKEVVKTRVEVDKEILKRLNIYKATNGLKSHNEAICKLLDKSDSLSK